LSLTHALFGLGSTFPCGDGSASESSNRSLYDLNGDWDVDLADSVHLFSYLFLGGPPPAKGQECISKFGCPSVCAN
jgi:hypothetical protein